MRLFLAALATLALVTLSGCGGTPGGPGVPSTASGTRPANSGSIGLDDGTFKLTTAIFGDGLKQGEQKKDSIGIRRGKNFDQDVTLKFEGQPAGLTIDPPSPVIKKGDTKVEITLKAADDAALGTHTIKVIGHPSSGPDATSELKVTVHKK